MMFVGAKRQVRKLQTDSGAVCVPNIGDARQIAFSCMFTQMLPLPILQDAVLKVATLFFLRKKVVQSPL